MKNMNFWEYKEDHSRGYYWPVSNKASRNQGGQLVRSLFFLIISLFKLAGSILINIASLLLMAFRWLWKLKKS